uniref:RGS domain-containing protein n=1 Tax=Globodera rostochiensis TaxID=31243 RepID=A0A914HEM1_GLORO
MYWHRVPRRFVCIGTECHGKIPKFRITNSPNICNPIPVWPCWHLFLHLSARIFAQLFSIEPSSFCGAVFARRPPPSPRIDRAAPTKRGGKSSRSRAAMWRTYTGTFTPKRKSSAAVHSSRANGPAASSSAHPKQRPATLPRRSSSLDLDELIQQVEKQQQIGGRVSSTIVEHVTEQPVDEPPPPPQQHEKEEEEEEEEETSNNSTHSAQQPRHWANSVFVDPTAPSIGASVSSAQQWRASPPALFVAQKQSQQQVSSSINQLSVPSPSPTNSEREEGSAASVDEGQRQTPPQQQQSSSMSPVMDGANGAEATVDQNAKNDSKSANENADANKSSDDNANMFERCEARNRNRPAPTMPTTEGIEYPRAASWSASTVAEIMQDSIGRKVFSCFLHDALAEENLLFVEEVEKLKKEKQPERIRNGVQALLDKYAAYINLSSVAMSKLRECAKAETPDPKSLDIAHKEIYKLLENDQFPRFRRSQLYIGFLEQLLPRAYAERWTTSFDALLGNQVGRHHFRQFLFNVRAEENLRFWESVIEYRQLRNKSTAMQNMGRTIQQQFLREGAHNEVFLPFGLRQRVEKKIREKDADETLFDESVKHVELILKNDPYVRFLQSKEHKQIQYLTLISTNLRRRPKTLTFKQCKNVLKMKKGRPSSISSQAKKKREFVHFFRKAI